MNLIELYKTIAHFVAEMIRSDIKSGINTDIILSAFNQMCEDERNGKDYIFDINYKNDLECLVKGGMTSVEISDMVCGGFRYCRTEGNKIVKMTEEAVNITLDYNADVLARFVLLYAPRCGEDSAYSNLYEAYVTEQLERGEFGEC